MGITGLWKVLDPARKPVSLHQLAIEGGFMENRGERRGLTIGIDASGWVYRASYRHGQTRNPELAALFARCAHLLTVPIFPVFVFDGPGRPSTKRNKKVRGNDSWLVVDMKAMLECFGFPCVEAPGEAEAQLAWMSCQGIIDAVLTDDSDAVVFGAVNVLRMLPEDKGLFTAMLYTAPAISALGLGPAELLLIAVLDGGDYSSGLQGCGIVNAVGLAKAGLGRSLVEALHAGGNGPLQVWSTALATELRENQGGHLTRCQPKLANAVNGSFLDLDTFLLFYNPLINTELTPAQIHPSGLNAVALAAFCQHHFLWGSGLLRKFATEVFPALAVQELVSQAVALDNGSAQHPITPSLIGDLLFRRQSPFTPNITKLRVSVTASPELILAIREAAAGASPQRIVPAPVERMRAWLPLVMVQHVFPHLPIPTKMGPGSRALAALDMFTNKEMAGPSAADDGASDPIEISSSPETRPVRKDKRYRMTTTQTPSGQEIIELDTDSDGSI